MNKKSEEEKYRGESSPTRNLNLIEKLISRERESAAGSKPLQAKEPSREGKFGIAFAEEPKRDPSVRLNQLMRNRLHETIQSEEFRTVVDSPPKAVRYLLNDDRVFGALDGVLRETFESTEPPVGVLRLFNLDEIPPLSVWHGDKCEFLFTAKGKPDAEFSVDAKPFPESGLTVDRASDSDACWLFSYAPHPNDKFPFTVTIAEKSDREPISRAFEITPLPILPAEQTTFDLQRRALPEIVDFTKPEIAEEKVEHTFFQDSEFVFNYKRPTKDAPLKLRKVQVVGERIVFDRDDDPYGLYTVYNGALDVERFEIYAETVVVRSPLRLHQTNVFINAKKLLFEGDAARIKTTPREKTDTPDLSQPGEDGLRAGNITLNICSFHTDPTPANVRRFDLTGGQGQAGGPGKDGTDGAGISRFWKDFEWTDSGIHFKKTAPDDWWIIYQVAYCRAALGIPIKAFSDGAADGWPGDGQSASPSGKPGEGGDGGILTSNVDLSDTFFVAGGKSGTAPAPPRGFYRGGSAGWPVKSIKYRADYMFAAGFTELGKRESKPGADGEVKYPAKPYGQTGEYRIKGSRYAWLHPVLLVKLLNRAKNDYLSNRIEESSARLEEYAMFLGDCKSDPSWNQLAQTERFELENICDEMQILLHRIDNNLDYFGNPAGWVPLLSFEVNSTVFSNEIDRASNILYYIYCIKNKAASAEKKFNALKSARSQLEEDIRSAISQYNDTASEIQALTIQAENLRKRTMEVQFRLQAEEEKLKNKAAPPPWITAARLSLKISGTIVSMIPVYQPAMGMVGSGMSLLSDFDPDKPWDTIIGASDITTTFLKSSFESASGDLKDKMTDRKKLQEADPSGSLSKKIKYLESARKSSSALSNGLEDIRDFMEKQSAPQPELNAELERLKSQSKEYQELVKEIESLTEHKRDFTEKLASAMQEASSLSNYIDRGILTIDAVNLDLKQVQSGLDRRTTAFLEDMERRAYDRLLEYHYYMAKAYEYRILEPYTQPIDFEDVIKRLEEIAKVDSWDKLDADTFKQTYAVVYKEKLAEIANRIFREYNKRSKEGTDRCEYLLSDDDLKRLNRGQTITVDFARYLPNEENLRIVDIRILMHKEKEGKGEIETTPVKEKYPPNAYVDLTFEHPGISWIKSGGDVYQFLHNCPNGENPLVWRARYTPDSDIVSHSKPSAAGESLLKSLLQGDALSDMMLYCRPSVWTDLQVSKSGYPNNGGEIDITHLRLELIYDYFKNAEPIVYKEIVATALQLDAAGAIRAFEADFQPYFIVEREDRNKRRDARGSFLRAYSPDWSGRVTINAQPKYGDWTFNKWTDATGRELPRAKGDSIVLDLKNNEVVCAQYLPSEIGGRRAAQGTYALPEARTFP